MMVPGRDVVGLLGVWMLLAAIVAARASGESLEEAIAALRSGYDTLSLPDLESALRILRQEVSRSDSSGMAHYHLARTCQALAIRRGNDGDGAAALRFLEEGVASARGAIERDQRVSAFHQVLGDLYGQLTAASGVVGKIRYGRLANASYTRALELDPRNALAHVGVGIGKLETPPMFGGSIAEALAAFRKAQELDPACVEAWVWEGIALRRRGDMDGARAALAKAVAVNPRSEHARRELAALEDDS